MSAAQTGNATTATDLVRRAARAHELDRYLSALLGPRRVQADLVALAAFAGEIGRIPAFVSEPGIGEIRLQWWRDAVAGAGDQEQASTGHPIADALVDAVRRHALPVELVLGLIDAEVPHLYDVAYADMAAFDAGISGSQQAQFELAWRMIAAPSPFEAPPVMLAAAARAYGIARVLVESPAIAAQGRLSVPRDVALQHGFAIVPPPEGQGGAGWSGIVAVLANEARRNLAEVRRGWAAAPRAVRLALLPSALVEPYLRACERGVRLPVSGLDIAPLTRVWRLWWALRGGQP